MGGFMLNVLYVGLGGFLGSALRYLVAVSLKTGIFQNFPLPTFLVNTVGALVLGFFISIGQARLGNNVFNFLVPGLLGGFTTYSTYSGETYLLIKQHLYAQATLYVLATFLGGLLAVAIGYYLGGLSKPTVL
jgi:CrcB protein